MNEKTAADKPATAEQAPQFDLEAWLLDADLPQESVDVYKAGSLPGEAKALQRQIELEGERIEADPERTAADTSRYQELERRYLDVLERWSASRITVYVSALSREKLQRMRDAHTTDTDGMEPAAANELFGYQILAAAIVGIAAPGETYTHEDGSPAPYGAVEFKPNQVRGLEKAIGSQQMQLLMAARQTAQNAVPEVDADFLHRSSGSTGANTQD